MDHDRYVNMDLSCMEGNINFWNISILNITWLAIGLILTVAILMLRHGLFKKRPELVSASIYGMLFVMYLIAHAFFRDFLIHNMLMDGGFYDYTFFWLLFPTMYYYFVLLIKTKYRLTAVMALLALFFVGMEEIYWGQKIIFYRPPELLLKILYSMSGTYNRPMFFDETRWCGLQVCFRNGPIYVFFLLGAFCYFVVFPILSRKHDIRMFFESRGIIVPSAVISIGVLSNYILADILLGIPQLHFDHCQMACILSLLFMAWKKYPEETLEHDGAAKITRTETR